MLLTFLKECVTFQSYKPLSRSRRDNPSTKEHMTNIAFIGAGPVAQQLARLASDAGHTTILSSRTPNKDNNITTFIDAARLADIAVITVPFSVTPEFLPSLRAELAGKIVIDATNPLNADYTPIILGAETSAAETIASLLPASRVVKAFNTIFANIMQHDQQNRNGLTATAFIASDHDDARKQVADLAASIGFAPMQTGPLHTARYLEAMAHLNIQIAFRENGGPNAAFVYHQASN
jgi:8-hydroxy-5-deazaflavin:NADPH oxidoreductase